jgi:uncharacterized protein YndB with AHSA1/START domain
MTLTTPSEREIVITRVFNAPRALVFETYTKPELIKRWAGGYYGWELVECEVDLRVGGAWRWLLRNAEGAEMGFGGVYREVVVSERLVSTEVYDQPWYPGEGLRTIDLTEEQGQTTLTMTLLHESKEARDMVIASGMDAGMEVGFVRLAELLATLV